MFASENILSPWNCPQETSKVGRKCWAPGPTNEEPLELQFWGMNLHQRETVTAGGLSPPPFTQTARPLPVSADPPLGTLLSDFTWCTYTSTTPTQTPHGIHILSQTSEPCLEPISPTPSGTHLPGPKRLTSMTCSGLISAPLETHLPNSLRDTPYELPSLTRLELTSLTPPSLTPWRLTSPTPKELTSPTT